MSNLNHDNDIIDYDYLMNMQDDEIERRSELVSEEDLDDLMEDVA